MPYARCPRCEKWHYTDEVRETLPADALHQLPPVALAILDNNDLLPSDFRRGLRPAALRTLADFLNYSSHAQILVGLRELRYLGLVREVPYGTKSRYTMTQRFSYRRAA